jgi:ATP synthase F1 gamma subunit
MAQKSEIDKEINQLEIFRVIARAYSQIASIRIQKTKDKVLMNREYYQKVNEVFNEVLASYYDEVKKLGKKTNKKGGLTFISHNGRNVAVLMSANSGMYGDLIARTFAEFIKHVRSNDVEVTIVGKYGLALFEQAAPDKPFTYFDFPDAATPDPKLLSSITTHLVQYEEIRFFYPEFKNIVVQKPQVLTLASGAVIGQKTKAKGREYLFEPTLEAILTFFESQLFSSLMQQTVEESSLAKFASRLLSMDRADENIRTDLKKLKLQKLKEMHLKVNKKQLELLNTVNWKQI